MRTAQNVSDPAPRLRRAATTTSEFALEVHRGLSSDPKQLPSRFFYDDRGSALFARICELPEYYVTRRENDILTRHASEISALMPARFLLVELGAGDGRKTSVLIDQFLRDDRIFTYIPVDISDEALRSVEERLHSYPIGVKGIRAEYSAGLAEIGRRSERKCLLFLGSNIGNMNPGEAATFFEHFARSTNRGDLALVGFDLQKEVSLLHAAYNDSEGVTAEFNLNLLDRINRELGGDFDRHAFEHYGYYNPEIGAMQSWIMSRKRQTVRIGTRRYSFGRGEGILVEHSYKYTVSMIDAFAANASFSVLRHFTDDEESFIDSLWIRR